MPKVIFASEKVKANEEIYEEIAYSKKYFLYCRFITLRPPADVGIGQLDLVRDGVIVLQVGFINHLQSLRYSYLFVVNG